MAVNLSPVGGVAGQFFDNNGNPLSGGKIFTYVAGTTTNQVTYTNATGAIAHTNPIILDSAGRVPSGEIWLTDGLQYKFVITDSNNVLIGTYDNIVGINSNFVNFTNQQEIQTATAGQTVFTLTTMQYQPATNSLSVFVDGVNQYGPGALYAYVETNSTTVTFTAGLHVGAEVKFTTSSLNSSAGGDAFQISYTPPFVASVTTNVGEKLEQTVSVKDFGAVGDDVADDTAAIQAAIDYGAPLGKAIYFPAGVYRTTQTVGILRTDPSQFGLHIVGENNIYTEIKADHSSGPVLALNRSFGCVHDIALTASTSRNTGAAGSNYGLLMEAPDLAAQAVAAMSIRRVRVIGQPSHGIVHVGNSQLSYYEQVLCQLNKGHGFVFDEGVITSRTNKGAPGLVNLVTCWSLLNTGHGLLVGSTSDTQLPVRFTMYNCEFAENALAAGVRLSADEIWMRATNVVFDTCAIGSVSASTIGNIRFAGENLELRNHRAINATHTLRVEKDHILASTFGIAINGLRVVALAQNPVVIITDIADVRDLTVNTYGSVGNMTSMFTSGALRAVWNRFPPISIVRKTTSQIVNNSTTLVDDSQLQLALFANETVYFEAVIRYSGDSTADIKIAFVAPAGATIRWDNYGSVYIASSDVIIVSNAEVIEGATRVFGAAAGVRTINIRGYAQMGSTSGPLKMQFAQNSADASDTTVFFNSVLKVFRNNANI
jgi:hypothetical protein